jgi:hypothetical protein
MRKRKWLFGNSFRYKVSLSDSRPTRFTSGKTVPRTFWLCPTVILKAMEKIALVSAGIRKDISVSKRYLCFQKISLFSKDISVSKPTA